MTETQQSPRFLSIEQVLVLHQLGLMEFGGLSGIRDRAVLESAVGQPQTGIATGYLHKRPFEMAAAYAFHLALNHPFLDGNKRVAWAAMRVFLHQEGFHLRVPSNEAVDALVGLIEGQWTKAELAAWIEQRSFARCKMDLRDFFLDLSYEELQSKLVAIADSWRSGGAVELTAIVNDASTAIPALGPLALGHQADRASNEQAIHYIQLFCAIYRIAEEKGYDW